MNLEDKKSLGKVELMSQHIVGTSKEGRAYDFDALSIVYQGVEIGITVRREDQKLFELVRDGQISKK